MIITKKLFSLFFLLFIVITGESQSVSIQFSKVDRALIDLYDQAKNKNYSLAKVALQNAQDQWIVDSQIFSNDFICSPLDDIGLCKIDRLFDVEGIVLDAKNFDMLAKYSLEIIEELQVLRSAKYNTAYPLTHLWSVYTQYQELNDTVHDSMFGLREWFEFEDMVSNIAIRLEYYDENDISYINKFFPHIDNKQHIESRDKVSECFVDFLYSLESGYRPDFEWPCDELGKAIYELILLYR